MAKQPREDAPKTVEEALFGKPKATSVIPEPAPVVPITGEDVSPGVPDAAPVLPVVPIAEPDPVMHEQFYPTPAHESKHSPVNQMILGETVSVNKAKLYWLFRCMIQGRTQPIFGQAAVSVIGELLGAKSHQDAIRIWDEIKEEMA